MKKPLFSIITITFNSENTIERTLMSVLNQTFKDYEYIIVDGASKDRTVDVVRKFEPLFEGRLKWKSEPDKGIYDAMNKGVLQASGTIIGIVNSDDWLQPDALYNIYNAYDNNNGNNNCIYVGGICFHHINGKTQSILPKLQLFYKRAKDYDMVGVNHPALFVPTSVYKRIGLYDTKIKISADVDFVLRCYYNGVGISSVPVVLSNMSDGGLSSNSSWKNIKRGLSDKKIRMSKYDVHPLKRYYLIAMHVLNGVLKLIIKRLHVYDFIMKLKNM